MSALPASQVNMSRMRNLSFSRAGWFCRFGRCELRRPVSVLMLIEVWMRPSLPGSSCSGRMKEPSMVSRALTVVSASRARCAPSPAASPKSRRTWSCAADEAASSRHAAEEVDGAPDLVRCGEGRPMPYRTMSVFLRRPMAARCLASSFSTAAAAPSASLPSPPSATVTARASRTSASNSRRERREPMVASISPSSCLLSPPDLSTSNRSKASLIRSTRMAAKAATSARRRSCPASLTYVIAAMAMPTGA
mmetsp:Transcript_9421/g.31914  ORF Transcript_9421/g.31914 Transcript_9421/m.31914 type:complete len:250 (-) Transcript_9421:452-1201(-)